jgi:hypothetical protein
MLRVQNSAMEDTKVFVKKYESCLSDIRSLNVALRMERLGVPQCDQTYIFDFFDRQIAFSGHDFVDVTGREVVPAVKFVLCNYLLK